MQELSMNVLDVAENSVAAGATLVAITLSIDTAAKRMTLTITDNGKGMPPEMAARVTDPFCTTRKTRKVGLGLPFLKMAAEMTGGALSIESTVGKGTCVTAWFTLGHIDLAPLGDMSATVAGLIQCSPDIDFVYTVQADGEQFAADTRELRAVLDGVPLGISCREHRTTFTKGERCMKSLEELAAIRDKMKQTVNTREAAHDSTRVVVGMATCGIAAGARPVLNAFTEEVARRDLHGVLVTQTGCIGICQYEPVVEITCPGQEKVTYVKMTPEKVARVVSEHLVGGHPVTEYTIGNVR